MSPFCVDPETFNVYRWVFYRSGRINDSRQRDAAGGVAVDVIFPVNVGFFNRLMDNVSALRAFFFCGMLLLGTGSTSGIWSSYVPHGCSRFTRFFFKCSGSDLFGIQVFFLRHFRLFRAIVSRVNIFFRFFVFVGPLPTCVAPSLGGDHVDVIGRYLQKDLQRPVRDFSNAVPVHCAGMFAWGGFAGEKDCTDFRYIRCALLLVCVRVTGACLTWVHF